MSIIWMFVITIVILQMSVFFTTIYLHRTLTHRSLKLHPAVGLFMHFHLMLFTGLQPRQWVAVHRKHHKFSDQEGDPHSPHLLGLWKVFFTNAGLYRKEANNPETIRVFTPDYEEDIFDKIPLGPYGTLLGLGVFLLMFGWAWGIGLFVFQALAYIFLNASINSICHMLGYKNFNNQATNVQWIALLTGGEGLHNNHHEFPMSARLAAKRTEIDPAWVLIWTLEKLGLAEFSKSKLAKAA